MTRPIVVSVAGSDPSGGAGIQADIKAIEVHHGFAAAVIAALTVQNTQGVQHIESVSPDLLLAQLRAVINDYQVAAIKLGMLGSVANIQALARFIHDECSHMDIPIICDPVLRASSGQTLLEHAQAYDALWPFVHVLTPNAYEASVFTNRPVHTVEDAVEAGEWLRTQGVQNIIVTGGHLQGADHACDVVITRKQTSVISGEPIIAQHDHGTGCLFASALATHIARGQDILSAATIAKQYVAHAIAHGLAIGGGRGPAEPQWHAP